MSASRAAGSPPQNPPAERLRSLPAQLIPVSGGVVLRRGTVLVEIAGDRAHEVLECLLAATAGEEGATVQEICARFAAPDRPAVESLLTELRGRRLLVPAGDSPTAAPQPPPPRRDGTAERLDVHFWHLGQRATEVASALDGRRIAVVGVNAVSHTLVAALAAVGATKVEVVDHPPLRNTGLADEPAAPLLGPQWLEDADRADLHCTVATSDFGYTEALRLWNRFCVERGIPFLPVVLDNLVGTVGPVVVPGETPCYECLRSRQFSHLAEPAVHRRAEAAVAEGSHVSALHPSSAAVLGELAAVELTKWFGGARLPVRQSGRVVEVNVSEPSVVSRRVLKVPRCPVCGPATRHSPASVRNTALDLR